MTFDEIFKKVKDMFQDTDVSHVTEHLAYQFNITGEGAGSFYVEVKDGKLNIEPYEYYDRDAIFICKADTNRTHLCPYWAETFLAQSSGRFALIALNFLIEIFLFPHA